MAYDNASYYLFVTSNLWPRLFKIELVLH
ncbi:hypothetical protein ACFLTL_01965 [Chloroflexota bacterium]